MDKSNKYDTCTPKGAKKEDGSLGKKLDKEATADKSVLGHSYYGQAYDDSLMKDNSYEPADTELEPKNTHYS